MRPDLDRAEIVWNLTLQYANIAVSLIQGVALVPVYLRFVGATDFGAYLIASGIAAWALAFDPGFSTLMLQRISLACGRSDFASVTRLATKVLRFNAAIVLAAVGVAALGAHFFSRIVDPNTALPATTVWWLVFASVVSVAVGMAANCATRIGVALRRTRLHALIAIWSSLGSFAATIAMLFLGFGVLSVPWGMILRGFVQFAWSYVLVRRDLKLHGLDVVAVSPEVTPDLPWKTMVWSSIETLAGTFIVSIDLALVGRYFGNAVVTSYSLTRRPVDLLSALLLRSSGALVPTVSYLTGKGATDELAKLVNQAGARILWLTGLACLGVLVFLEPLVGLWVGPQAYVGGAIERWLALGFFLNVLNGSLSNLFWAGGNAMAFFRWNSLSSILIGLGMIVGIALHGIEGMLIGAMLPRLLFATCILPSLAFAMLRASQPHQRTLRREMVNTILAAAAAVLVFWALGQATNTWWRETATLTVFALGLGLLSPQMREDLRAVATRFKAPRKL